jgi:selenocysteine lyase/cysteine desulfurase
VAWFGPRLDGGVPLEETWMGRDGSEDFQRLVDYRDAYQPGARRYDVGQVANFTLVPGLVEALGLLLRWGPARVQEHAAGVARPLTRGLRERGWSVEPEEGRSHHLFGVRPPAGFPLERLADELERRRVVVSLRGDAVRVSPHLYNGPEDVAAFLQAVDAAQR